MLLDKLNEDKFVEYLLSELADASKWQLSRFEYGLTHIGDKFKIYMFDGIESRLVFEDGDEVHFRWLNELRLRRAGKRVRAFHRAANLNSANAGVYKKVGELMNNC